METQEFQIRAKKISELDNFDRQIDDNTYLIIGYNNGTVKQNYKLTLSNLVSLIEENASIDDDTLLQKLNMFIYNDQIHIPTGSQGPQGPQGPQGAGASIDVSSLQRQIDDLYRIIGQYHSSYSITYNLENISPSGSNPTSIDYGNTAILYFIPNNGYKMPNIVSVTGCDYTYSNINKSISISNPTSDIIINISGVKANYSISYNFNHINYEIVNNDQSSYQIGESIRLNLTAEEDYKLPSSLNHTNCNIDYRLGAGNITASLVITCTGEGNMVISGNATSSVVYYFGYVKSDDSSYINVVNEYYPNGEFKGLQSVSVLSTSILSSSLSCPFDVNSTLTINNVGNNANIILLVPSKYFDIQTKEFIDASNQKYKMYPKLFAMSPLTFPYSCTTLINGITYYALLIEDQYNGAEYIFKK